MAGLRADRVAGGVISLLEAREMEMLRPRSFILDYWINGLMDQWALGSVNAENAYPRISRISANGFAHFVLRVDR